ncbi:coiled-coil domain-containing protein 113-like isoform X2 [Pollicipes pollicipes]|uniref:coiled-coil domain-containing protein 113-like isoform X2 n=1 Tax=Pollicipes pollicipes TaxID=41117 RepID=UPI001884AB8C|nr:coiled-coil domain-containing protein 113-like isoform X2 [Pollicipes pollicipes]
MSTSTLVSLGGVSARSQSTYRAVPDQQLDQLTDEQLAKSTEQLQANVKMLQLETDVFEKFLQRVDPWEHAATAGGSIQPGSSVQSTTPSLSPAQSASDVSTSDQSTRSTLRGRRKQSGKGGRSGYSGGMRGVALVRLTPEQRCDVASRELEELNEALQAQENQHERSLQNLRAVLEAADIRLKEIQNVSAAFEKDVIKGAVNPRSSRVMSEKVQRHFDELNKSRDALLEKLRLKNANMKTMTRKLETHMRQKEEMGEVLRQVDFDQLKIENQQFLDRIEDKNNTMIQLKLLAGRSLHELNQQKRKMQALTEEGRRLDAATQREQAIGQRVTTEHAVVEKQLVTSRAINDKLRTHMANYRVPPTMDYIRTNDRVYKLKRKVIIWQRKLDISKMTLLNLKAVHGVKSEQLTPSLGLTDPSAGGSGVLDQSEAGGLGRDLEEGRRMRGFAASQGHRRLEPGPDDITGLSRNILEAQ